MILGTVCFEPLQLNGCGRPNNSHVLYSIWLCTIIMCGSNVDNMVFVPTGPGPPSPPEPVITVVNSTLVHMSWPPPLTWTNHSITHYNITLTNTNEGT